eukprot:1180126-Prorocentrum_minimum.AAC.1
MCCTVSYSPVSKSCSHSARWGYTAGCTGCFGKIVQGLPQGLDPFVYPCVRLTIRQCSSSEWPIVVLSALGTLVPSVWRKVHIVRVLVVPVVRFTILVRLVLFG